MIMIILLVVDVVKQRMQLGYYSSIAHCVSSIARQEGVVAFYRSLPLTVTMNIPYSCVLVAVNESMRLVLKPFLDTVNPKDGRRSSNIGITTALFSGAIAGAVAAAVTTPLDVVKTRLQTQHLPPCPRTVQETMGANGVMYITNTAPESGLPTPASTTRYHGTLQTFRVIVQTEGFRGLTRGILPRVLTNAPAAGISWAVYEGIKNALMDDNAVQ